ncbi:hypothetical protein RN001_000405 [Aquatica leii]|uniref:Uncharacterized protein n=1 Tax=Aquatica leii TaxID=1421715 RepID=A0AAN7Q2Y0_9COLE|nr:hypothetical protein RN001_000405 [Aquatica leii]
MINEAIENALKDVLKSTRELDIIVEDLRCYTAIPVIKSPEDEEDVLIDDRMIDTSNGYSIDANRLQNFTSLPIEKIDDNDLIDTNSDMRKDLSDIPSAGIIDDLIMRSYDDKMTDEIIEDVRVTVDDTVVKYNDSTDTETFSASDFENEIKETDEEIEQSEYIINPNSSAVSILVEMNKFYAVYYDEGWFIGKIIKIDCVVDSPIVEMTFLKQSKKNKRESKYEFKWPLK